MNINEDLILIIRKALDVDFIAPNLSLESYGLTNENTIAIMKEIGQRFGSTLLLDDISPNISLSDLNKLVISQSVNYKQKQKQVMDSIAKQEFYETTSAQRRIYSIQQYNKSLVAYNLLSVRELTDILNYDRLIWSFHEMVQRHESLRTSFGVIDGKVVQYIHEDAKLVVETEEVSEQDVEQIALNFVRPFDLSIAPLMRVKILKVGTSFLY